jgi:ribosomal protein S12 methylthiotransferase
MFDDERILKYFDIPMQHASKHILKAMKREGDSGLYERVIDKIRNRYPSAVLRTTFIAGFPGETNSNFNELMVFIERVRFNHLGIFVYSPQPLTTAYRLGARVEASTAEKRKALLLETQRAISRSHLEQEIGKIHQVLIEEKLGDEDIYFGRSYHFAPEVDGLFVVRSQDKVLDPGTLMRAEVTDAHDYDLHGCAVW